jgi:hypothetical protein
MTVGPALRGLDSLVELIEGGVFDLNSSPDRRLGFKQRDPEPVETFRRRDRTDAFRFFERLGDTIDDMAQ